MRLAASLTAAAFLAFAPPAAANGTSPLWAEVGGWDVRVDTGAGNDCYMAAITAQTRTVVRIGYLGLGTAELYMLLADSRWQSLVPGNVHPLDISIDGRRWNDTRALALALKSGQNALAMVVPTDLLTRFMYGQVMAVTYRGHSLFETRLNGTLAAGQSMLECQAAMNDAAESTPAPSVSSADPFARPF